MPGPSHINETSGLVEGQRFNPYKLFTGVFIPIALLRYGGIGLPAKVMWGRLAMFAGEDGRCYPKQETLADELGLKVRQVRNLLVELEKEGFIARDKAEGLDRLHHKNDSYSFIFHAIFCTPGPAENCRSGAEENCRSLHIRRESSLRDSEGSRAQICTSGNESPTHTAMAVITDLNVLAHRNFKVTPQVVKLIATRLKEGFTLNDMCKVNQNMVARWGKDPKMKEYLRPITLYGTKMDSYLNTPAPSLSSSGIVSQKTEKNIEVAGAWVTGGGQGAGKP